MERHEMRATSSIGEVSDTIALGSMLVFASVMPPLGPDTADSEVGTVRQRRDATGESDLMDAGQAEMPAWASRRSFDS